MNARAWLAAIGALAQLALGCDQVGEPLVGHNPPGVPFPRLMCGPAPECNPPEQVERARFTVHPVDRQLCGGPSPDYSEPCEQPPPPPPGDAGAGSRDAAADGDAGVPSDGEFGDISGDPNAPVLPPCEPEPDRVLPLPATLGCADFVSVDAPGPLSAGERLPQAEWLDANLRIESSVPRVVVIERLTLANAYVELRGPVTLRIDASGRAPGTPFDEIEGLRVSGVATAAGAPRLELEGVKIKNIVIGDDAHPFEGAVSLRSSELLEVGVIARAVELESTRVEQGRLHAQILTAAGVVLSDLEIESERAVLSASVVRKSQLKRCGELTLVTTRIRESEVAECSGSPARFYKVQFVDGAINGVIEADGSSFIGSTFGTRGPTELRVFGTSFERASFCAGVERLVASGDVPIRCSMCELVETFTADAVCVLANSEIKGGPNLCLGLLPDDEPPKVCELPWPEFHAVDERF